AVHHAAFFTTGQYLDRFLDVIAGEQQTAQYGTHRLIVITFLGPLPHPVGQCLVVGKFLGRILRHVAHIGILRPLHGTAIRLQTGDVLAAYATQQRGFTGTVGTDDGDAFTGFDHDAEVVENGTVVFLGNALGFHCQAVQFLLAFEAYIWILAAGWFDILDLDLLDLLGTRSCLTRL